MRSCEKFEPLISLELDGEATEAERAALAAHLETCPGCRNYAADLRRIRRGFVRTGITVPEDFAAQVMARVRETEQDPPEAPGNIIPFPRWKRWAALAACCAVAALGLWAFRGADGVKGSAVSADDMALASAQMTTQASTGEADHDGPAPLMDEAGAGQEDADLDESAPEEYAGAAKASAREEGQRETGAPSAGDAPLPEPAAAAPPLYAAGSGAVGANGPADAPAEDAGPAAEDTAHDRETPEVDAPRESEPVEVIGVPEPGILIVFGSTARAWVEDTLGQEWAVGGSYPLTAEQYGELMRTLDEAAELYRVEPGEGYCLMTE